jgi:hypothetical protein
MGAVRFQRLNLALFIDAEHQRAIRRIEIQADDVPYLILKLRIVRNLELLHPVRLDVVTLPNALHHHPRNAQFRGQHADAPVCGIGWSGLQGSIQNHLLYFGCESPA